MMTAFVLEALPAVPVARRRIELVERKGLGHPDTICDALVEAIAVALNRMYRAEAGAILIYNVEKALRAAAVGLAEGMIWDHILEGLQERREQLRLVAVPGPNGSTILDDTYNASPESTIAALNLLAELEGP